MLALAALAVLAAAGCGGSEETTSSASPARFAGTVVEPAKPAPPLRLRDWLGREVDLRDFRGKAVLVTFVYTHCPDVCPMIVSNLHTTLAELGPKARNLRIIAVSTDPRRDTPAAVAEFLRAHRMTGKMQFLIGDRAALSRTWKQWGVIAKRDPTDPESVEHSAPIYGINTSGEIATSYTPHFRPAQIVHDAPLLAQR
ncbi:MAG: SCO family protein [Solirubrobacterales bacterium]